jgi:hypothetical protein
MENLLTTLATTDLVAMKADHTVSGFDLGCLDYLRCHASSRN